MIWIKYVPVLNRTENYRNRPVNFDSPFFWATVFASIP